MEFFYKMTKQVFKKSLCILLTLAMLLSLFTCMIAVPASAASNGKMFHVNGSSTTNLKIGFRNNTFNYPDAIFVAGKQYRFSCKYKNTNPSIGFRGSMFWFWYYNTSDSMAVINPSSAGATESYDSSTFLYTLTFTMPADCRDYNNAYIYFADYNGDLSGYEAYFADFRLENLTDDAEVPMFPDITSGNVYTSALAANQKWRIATGWNSKVTIEDIGSTFDPVTLTFNGGDMNEDGTTNILDLVRYKKMMAGIVPATVSLDCDENGEENAADLTVMFRIMMNAGVPGMLQNTYNKLRYGKSLNIGYIGGSVTGGTGASSDDTCWRALVTDYFEENFPLATVTENSMGVGGTGSYLGAARFDDNILKKNPDLVFIEFAINDRYNGIPTEQTKQDIEYMIKALHNKNAYADIVIVLITDRTAFGTEYPALLAIKSVAEYYRIPVVDVGAAMYEELGGSTADWNSYYYDSVHPLDAGYEVYADAITDKLDEILVNGGKSPHSLPSAPVCANGFTTVTLLTRDSFKPFRWGTLDSDIYDAHTWFDNDTYEMKGSPLRSSLNRCFSNIMPKYIYPKYDGATLEFTVTGNNIGMIGTVKENQSLTVTLDNGETKTINGSSRAEMTEYPLWNSLSNTTHTVRIVAHGDGPYIAIAAIVVGS